MAVERKQPKRESPEELAKKRTRAAKKDEAGKADREKKGPRADATKKAATKRRTTPKPKPEPEPEPKAAIERPIVHAQARYVRSSARKARLVIEHIRGKSIDDARAVLRHSPRGVAGQLEKLLDSAVANAENNHELVADDLFVKEAFADEGPTLRRFRPRAQGRATRIRKRTSHLSINLSTRE